MLRRLTDRRSKTLAPVRPNEGIRRGYQRRIDTFIKRMHADITAEITRQYAALPPELASDAIPAAELGALMRRLKTRWMRRIDGLAPDLAGYFATAAADRSDAVLKSMLKKAGFTVAFKLTASQNDILQATVTENVNLIKSIASVHLDQVEGLVMRSVTAGRDLHVLAKGLQEQLGVTRRRAAFIALDQNNKATSALQRNRQIELGLKARWLHSGGGKVPRPDHVAFSKGRDGGPIYDPKEGALISGKRIWPGQLIGCRCVACAVLPGFE
jgi:uncharacterized protein with gpF-like domain